MTDTITELREADPAKPPSPRRGPFVALAVAAAVILIIGVTAFTVLSNDEQPVATQPPVTTTTVAPTTTQPPATTVPPQSLLPADTPPQQVAAALQARWDVGDTTGGWALFHPDTELFLPADFRQGVDQELWYRSATGMEIERECELRTPAELEPRTPRVPGAEMVTCVETITSGLQPGVVVAGGTTAVEVANGWVYDLFILDYVGATNETASTMAYGAWMQEYIPDRYAELFNGTTLSIVVNTREAREGHRELVPFFVADTGPRPELAMPADTPLLDVVAEFHARWDAGDIEGYEALIHPAIGYPPGNDAEAAWFGLVTGMTTERTCTHVDDITVQCDEIARSALTRGEVVNEVTVEYIGRVGWILAINVPAGAMADPMNATGVAEYRDWVRANAPDEFDQLFVAGLMMRLDTPEVRAQHEAMIAAFLAATN